MIKVSTIGGLVRDVVSLVRFDIAGKYHIEPLHPEVLKILKSDPTLPLVRIHEVYEGGWFKEVIFETAPEILVTYPELRNSNKLIEFFVVNGIL